jgi:hypothetical protein
MSMGDKETDRTTIRQHGENPSEEFDIDGVNTQIRRGQSMATITVVEGPGAGTAHVVYPGDNAIGRGPQNRIALPFGDEEIHREGHAWISARDGQFSIRHGGKNNPVYVDGVRVTDSRSIKLGDQIKLGVTTLRLDPV